MTALAAVIAATLTFLPFQTPTDLPAPPAPAAEAAVAPAPAPDYAAVARLIHLDHAAMAGDRGASEQLIRLLMPDGDRAVKIARRESGLRCDARNPRSSASGLFQTLRIHEPRANRLGLSWGEVQRSCLANIAVAHSLWAEQGWRPWRL